MIAALTAGSAVCCFGAAYAAHMMLPVKPVNDAEILKNQSTLNTVNLLTFNELKTRPLQERIDAYTSSRANLQDVMMVTADRPTLNQSYVAIAKKIPTLPAESKERGQYEFLKKAADDHFTGFIPVPANLQGPSDLSGFRDAQDQPPPPPKATTPPASAPQPIPAKLQGPSDLSGFVNRDVSIPTPPLPAASSRNLAFSPVRARSPAGQTPKGGRRRRSSVSE